MAKRQRPGQHNAMANMLATIDGAGFDCLCLIEFQPDRLATDCG